MKWNWIDSECFAAQFEANGEKLSIKINTINVSSVLPGPVF